ncbi:hypothetical protein GCM10027275_51230 [Rhabdobacter roseus]|uniref:Uncharacterized protein n=1 Tax=Rhabdobacter roseus TaxID=1655419 RepID=A0A840U097_9BACT|nr:hypothetical protein [Rhabdobacter roseus]MBB5287197.1 hypothetical protein [Rhabdobacter roseus]
MKKATTSPLRLQKKTISSLDRGQRQAGGRSDSVTLTTYLTLTSR